MDGLPAFYGNPVSAYADRHLDLIGIGGMLAISARTNLNTLAAMRYKREFGVNNIFSVQTEKGEHSEHHKQTAAERFKGNIIFKNGVTFAKLNQYIRNNDKLTNTTLTEEYDFEKFRDDNPTNILLFTFDAKNHIHFFSANQELKPSKEWVIVSISTE
jgi:ssRNA-specific RNase YbeY (16S rRNA maturation enzyme)